MKKQLTILFILLLFKSGLIYGICGGLKCSTSNGISLNGTVPHSQSEIDSLYINTVDSVECSFTGIGGCGLSQLKILVYGVQINYVVINQPNYTLIKVKILGVPGKYVVQAFNGSTYVVNNFTFNMNAVGISELITNSDDAVSVFPNPANSNITILSKNTKFKSIKLLSALGAEIKEIPVQSNNCTISLSGYPPGIYFIHVATLSDKIIIRKIVLL